MDAVLLEDRDEYRNADGCTVLVSLFILGASSGGSKNINFPVLEEQGIDDIPV